MEERMRFVLRRLGGEAMSDLCREFGISRKTGYKIFERYEQHGLEALTDRSRRPVRYANQLPEPVERMIVRAKQDKPHWGARKIRELMIRRLPGDMRMPATSTIHAVLDRHGLVQRMRPRRRATGTPLSQEPSPMRYGAPTSRVSSSSATADTVIRSPSPTMPHTSCSCAKRWIGSRRHRNHCLRTALQGGPGWLAPVDPLHGNAKRWHMDWRARRAAIRTPDSSPAGLLRRHVRQTISTLGRAVSTGGATKRMCGANLTCAVALRPCPDRQLSVAL